ncbi:MAG: dihydrofolate reductase family protein [Candidatus Amesbacteria bacterium]|nr:dihydrofolate reductase family protein [Candidatus Amesbacteria bacterium]
MKVILYAALTANGMVAKIDGNSDWPSPEDFDCFNTTCRKAGGVIMGRHTFDNFNGGNMTDWPNADGLHIVLTHQNYLETKHPNIKLAKSPLEAIQIAKQAGLKEIVVCGGSQTFGIFMKEKLVDEIYMDIEPLLFGEGMPFFNAGDFEQKLRLLETKNLSSQTIQLHYEVVK